ncbi:MAG: hypothetical protein ACYTFU_05755, partial [Planctomycetota bacterium]
YQCIGREAGWLVGATAAGKTCPADAPHIMCLPERPFEKVKFLEDVKKCYEQYGFVSVVCGEGVTYADGRPVSASEIEDAGNSRSPSRCRCVRPTGRFGWISTRPTCVAKKPSNWLRREPLA